MHSSTLAGNFRKLPESLKKSKSWIFESPGQLSKVNRKSKKKGKKLEFVKLQVTFWTICKLVKVTCESWEKLKKVKKLTFSTFKIEKVENVKK